jgi:hypothetical protein
VQLRRTDTSTGQVEQVLVPCGNTLASVCPPCAERAKALRTAQCREGWHLDNEPVTDTGDPDDYQRWLIETRAETPAKRDHATADREDIAELDALNGDWTRRSPTQACAETCCPPAQYAATDPPAAARTHGSCPGAQWRLGRSARPTPPQTARPSARRCSSH